MKQCFNDYFVKLNIDKFNITGWLTGKAVLEYGPGDILGVALLMKAHGAKRVICVDRFPLAKARRE